MLSGGRAFRLSSRCLNVAWRQSRSTRYFAARFHSSPLLLSSSEDEALSPILLERARAIAVEHSNLSTANVQNYDVAAAKKIGELGPVVSALKEWDDAQNSLSELRSLLDDAVAASDAELRSLAQSDIEATASRLSGLASRLKTSLIPPHPFAALPAMLEIHPGAGGAEASLFAQALLSMYQSFCARRGWTTSLTSYTADDAVTDGLKEAILEIQQPGAYDTLRTEAGVHRVQRVPATEKKGRTHTSAVSVLVLPCPPDSGSGPDHELNYNDPSSDYYVAPAEVRSETMRASGAGGQHVNKTDSAVRLTHLPTGIVVAMQESRSQHSNRAKAWQVLRAKLAQKRREEREAEMVALRRSVMGGVARTGREDKVRTYNYAQNRVTDHRCGAESQDLPGVVGGDAPLDGIMDAVREWMAEGEVQALQAEVELRKREEENKKKSGNNNK